VIGLTLARVAGTTDTGAIITSIVAATIAMTATVIAAAAVDVSEI
jgi:hypothetical protein